MKFVHAAVAMFALTLIAALFQTSTQAQAKPRVVSSFSIVGELVQRVGGDRIDHRVIVGANTDSHTYEPTPQDIAALTGASIVIQNGLGFESWLDRLYEASGSRAMRVSVADGLDTLKLAGEDEAAESGGDVHGHAHGDGHQHGEFDPHVWHDVNNLIRMTAVVRDSLALIDPAGAETYQANADQYIAELQALDAWVVQQVSSLPSERRKLVTAHDTFQYFARRYGFEMVGTAVGSVSTEVADPSAGAVADLVDEIRAAGVPVIFGENVSNPRLMQQISSAAGVQLVSDLYTDALGGPGTAGATIDGLMRHNVSRMVEALSR